jgi:hypothetical protein
MNPEYRGACRPYAEYSEYLVPKRSSSNPGFGPSGLQHAHWPPYSTVTDLARFLGWSTSQPRRTAVS